MTINNSNIGFGTHIKVDSGGSISISKSFIGRNCVITSKSSIMIKGNCLIAEMVVIRDQDHQLDSLCLPANQQSFTCAPIEINENVWVASKATILKGVSIGKGSVVAASAVVTKSIGSHELWGGIPAKYIKNLSLINEMGTPNITT
ncbi:MAG: acyltransferase [Ginsengibacter sp.]